MQKLSDAVTVLNKLNPFANTMVESTVLRKRNATSPPSTPRTSSETPPAHRRRESSSFERRKTEVEQLPFNLRVTAPLFVLIVVIHIMLSRYGRPPVLSGDILLLDPIELLSTVPVGFGLDLPKNLVWVKIFLDSRLVTSISDPAELSTNNDGHNFNFGTCDT